MQSIKFAKNKKIITKRVSECFFPKVDKKLLNILSLLLLVSFESAPCTLLPHYNVD